MKTNSKLLSFLVFACASSLALSACGDSKSSETANSSDSAANDDDDDDDDATGNSSATSTTGGTTAPTAGETDSGTAGPTTDDPTATTGCEFICKPDMEGVKECDIWAQDCPDGEKCMPWDDQGGGYWNATKCSPVADSPGQSGDECTVEGSAVSGVDDCDKGLLCWFVNEENVGTCLDMCTGSQENAQCPIGQVCDISNDGVLILCLHTCNPIVVDCPEGQICFPTSTDDGKFICDFDASGDQGVYGDPCEFINVCDPGLFCADAASVPGCVDSLGCCTPFCDTENPVCPDQDQGVECVKWHEPGTEPPGLENIGVCIIPA
ncbi:MAG: ribulose phosphate epimerase [Myxococcales bacterium]|nr:ribulose phosphate epimerase [Myxococcales bacterium]MCB9752159.1 ribulose phosphate epimerase [Myxococcales bacterium]